MAGEKACIQAVQNPEQRRASLDEFSRGLAISLLTLGISWAGLAAAPPPAPAQQNYAVSVQNLQAPKKAKKILSQALKALKKNHRNRGLRLLSEAIHIAPYWAAPYFTRGVVFLRSQLYPQALQNLQTAARLGPDSSGMALTAIGDVYRHLHNFAMATLYLHRATASRTLPWQAYYELGRVNYSTGHYRRAGTNFKLALNLDPRHALITHVVLGNVYIKLGQYAQARREYLKYLHMRPDAPEKAQIKQILKKIDVVQRFASIRH